MRTHNPTILITGEIDNALLNAIISKGFIVDVIPFIQTEIITTIAIKQAIKNVLQLDSTIIFTSSNAVEAVHANFQHTKPNWKIYCTGNTTRILVEKFFGKESIIAAANNATALAKKIIANNADKEIYFFCGDKKRDELPALLSKNSIVVNEIEVYTTTILQHIIQKKYDAVLFFSPSAAEGFFALNDLSNKTTLFAIGTTTADALKQFSGNTIVVSDKPGKKELIEKAVKHLDKSV